MPQVQQFDCLILQHVPLLVCYCTMYNVHTVDLTEWLIIMLVLCSHILHVPEWLNILRRWFLSTVECLELFFGLELNKTDTNRK